MALQGKIPPRMSGSEVLGCVELVTNAFKDGSELAGRLCRRHKRGKDGQKNYIHQVLLFQALDDGAKKVQEAYNDGYKRFGANFKLGDDGARERLLCVAIELHADIVQAVHPAVDDEKTQIDLVGLHEKTITLRHDALRSLADLRQRLDILHPVNNLSRFSPDSSVCGDDLPRKSAARQLGVAGRTAPPPPERSALRRMLSNSSATSHRRTKSEDTQSAARPESFAESVIIPPEPLSFTTPVTRIDSNQSASQMSVLSGTRHQRSKSETKKVTPKRIESIRHPDNPDFINEKPAKPRARADSASAAGNQSKRNSIISFLPRHNRSHSTTALTEPESPALNAVPSPTHNVPPSDRTMSLMSAPPASQSIHPAERSQSFTSAPATGMIPMTLDTRPSVFHSGYADIVSPIYEVDDSSSVNSRDYDAESMYSQPETASDTPATPITEPSSSGNSDPATPSSERMSGSLTGSSLRDSISERKTRDSLGEQFTEQQSKRPATAKHTHSLSTSSGPTPTPSTFFLSALTPKPMKHRRAMTADGPVTMTATPNQRTSSYASSDISYEATVTATNNKKKLSKDKEGQEKKLTKEAGIIRGPWHKPWETRYKPSDPKQGTLFDIFNNKLMTQGERNTVRDAEAARLEKVREKYKREQAKAAQWATLGFSV